MRILQKLSMKQKATKMAGNGKLKFGTLHECRWRHYANVVPNFGNKHLRHNRHFRGWKLKSSRIQNFKALELDTENLQDS